MPYIFYDTETTGKSTSFDQILQFAAIKADDGLNVIDTFDVRCRLLPHIVPSPEALLITDVHVTDLTNAPMSHFEMMRQIHAKMDEWSLGGAVFLGWNSMRFDEAMLRQAYYQTLLPIYQTNTNGNGRADMMRMAQLASACVPTALAIPLDANGKRSFKLGQLAKANAIVLDNAHEAMADTSTTLAIAQIIKRRMPELWDAMIANASKAASLNLIKRNSVLLLSETYGGVPYNLVIAPIIPNATNANEWATFDLRFDPLPLLDADDTALRTAIDGKVKQIRRISINAQPPLLPLILPRKISVADDYPWRLIRPALRLFVNTRIFAYASLGFLQTVTPTKSPLPTSKRSSTQAFRRWQTKPVCMISMSTAGSNVEILLRPLTMTASGSLAIV